MDPFQTGPNSGPDDMLEGRLRNLILTNSNANMDNTTFPPLPHAAAPAQRHQSGHPSGYSVPPGDPSLPPVTGAGGHDSRSGAASPKASRKRPNQAQRRQMSAQLSIPIDPRPMPPPGPHSARPYISPPAQSTHHYVGHHRHQLSGSFHHPYPPPTSFYDNASQTPGHPHTPWTPTTPYSQHYGPQSAEHVSFGARRYPFNPSGGPAPDVMSMPMPTPMPMTQHEELSPRAARNPPGFHPRRQYQTKVEEVAAQSVYLEGLCNRIVSNAEIQRDEIAEKEAFREKIEHLCQEVIAQYEFTQNGIRDFPAHTVSLKCFGSLSSGFATKASDMDLGLLSPLSTFQPDSPGSPIPRLLEKAFLERGLGARLLTRTRVPIIKLCEKPPRQLYKDLIEAREKWEKGIDDQVDGLEDDGGEEPSTAHEASRVIEPLVESDAPLSITTSNDIPVEKKLASLRQSEKASTSTYYTHAKRILRRLGGRDITVSNSHDFKLDDFRLLNSVCLAFAHGVYDTELRTRLVQYYSLDGKERFGQPTNRSLMGVLVQIDGERVVMQWEKRQISDRSQEWREQAEEAVKNWKALQNKTTYGVDPVAYTRELQLAFTKLTKPPSVQLVMLEQSQHESPSAYASRTSRIHEELHKSDLHTMDEIRNVVVRKYMAGIYHESIRTATLEFFETAEPSPNLKSVVRRHKSLHLAMEFDKALERGLYPPEQAAFIQEYILLLRQPLRKSSAIGSDPDYVVAVTKQTAALQQAIRDLPDPGKMTPNRPKDPYHDRLEFPKTGAGVQCDINFSAHLALQNTLLLRCYSRTDPRVRPLVLFVKHWAKVRGINSGYRGTLSSYGYVLMMLHYLVNVAQPFVCPNLQKLAPNGPPLGADGVEDTLVCKGRNVAFWRNEEEIMRLAQANQLNNNKDTIGYLLRGFFEYYAQNGPMSTLPHRGFDWGREVLSLRTAGGIVSKQEKGWTGAKTVFEHQSEPDPSPIPPSLSAQSSFEPQLPSRQNSGLEAADSAPVLPAESAVDVAQASARPSRSSEIKEIRHRYLFAIEDPFELDHNVARTVTHNGIVAIRDEFRRAWRIIRSAGTGYPQENFLEDVNVEKKSDQNELAKILEEIHGPELFD